MQPELVKKLAAEFVGTFGFFFIGYTGIAAIVETGAPVYVPIGFGFGLAAMIFAFGHISGGHFNPAVTVGIVLDKRLPALEGVFYILAQIIGAIAAAVVVMLTVSQQAVADGITKPGAGITDISAVIIEATFTAVFLVVILVSSKRAPQIAALAIPLTLVAIHFAIATVTGSSVNPARSIGSALVGGDLNQLWIYIVGPTIGGIIGWAVYLATNNPNDPDDLATVEGELG